MTMYEIRVTQLCRDYYRVHADSPKDAEAPLWASLRAGKTDIKDGLTLVELNDTIDSAPTIDYTVQLSPEGEPIL